MASTFSSSSSAESRHSETTAGNFREDRFLLPDEEQTILSVLGLESTRRRVDVSEKKDTSANTDANANTNACELLRRALTSEAKEWAHDRHVAAGLSTCLMRLCTRYLLKEKRRGRALDPVANFHVRNGASLERLNWMADTSEKGLRMSAGMMVNYMYRLERIKDINEAYINDGTIAASSTLRSLL
ncbi:hypothetical protein CBR_g2795 [Chara braunii]|uniref:Malonyl-CoA decarboxylase C-terminal domain-containing protein n=1 Tax=Chara braunii TaxID=69332 RepID=A0A388KDW1_CHABU|nr:hypothetical protein CBR_g2795 [Chara braunii]|eukprot:GBG68244.1 hypothetical protein CBR_g2795 [Chara braunii]